MEWGGEGGGKRKVMAEAHRAVPGVTSAQPANIASAHTQAAMDWIAFMMTLTRIGALISWLLVSQSAEIFRPAGGSCSDA